MTHEQQTHDPPGRRPRISWVLIGFLAIAAFFLITEHRAHLLGVLPFLLLALCPLLHLFGHGGHGGPKLKLVQPGSLSPADYKDFVGDLTNFMVYTAEPGRNARISLGWKVLAYVLLFWGLAYLLKKEFWKDVH